MNFKVKLPPFKNIPASDGTSESQLGNARLKIENPRLNVGNPKIKVLNTEITFHCDLETPGLKVGNTWAQG